MIHKEKFFNRQLYKIHGVAIFWLKNFYLFLYYIVFFHRLHCCQTS